MAAAATLACAQDVTSEWCLVSCGGGISTAGIYTLTSTIGQPATGRLNSLDFTIDGGFWSIIAAIQEPGAPLLSVRLTETNTVVVSWPLTWPAFALQENADLNTTNWANVVTEATVFVVGQDQFEKQVVVPMPLGSRFYRLQTP